MNKVIICILLSLLCICQLTGCKEKEDDVLSKVGDVRPVFNIQIPSEPVSTQIPFEINGQMIVIECRINGLPCRMLLDTGAETIGIFKDKLQKFHLKTIGTDPNGYSAAGYYNSNVIEKFTLELAEHINVISKSCTTLASFKDKPDIDGVIGGPVFVPLNAVIDYKHKTLTLSTNDRFNSAEHEDSNQPANAAD